MSGIIFGGKNFTAEEAEKLDAMCRERKVSMDEAVRTLFGIVLLMQPGAGALALIWLIGSMSIVLGVIYVALALRLKRHKA